MGLAFFGAPVGAEEIPLRRENGTYEIAVRINETLSLDFTLDTGASLVFIPRNAFLALARAGTVSKSDLRGTGTAHLADGSEVQSTRFVIHQLRVGRYLFNDVLASVGSEDATPLLGQSLLSKLPPWTIDYGRSALVFNPQGGSSAPVPNFPSSVPPGVVASPQVIPPGEVSAGGYGSFAYDQNTGQFGFSWNQVNQAWADYTAQQGCSGQCSIVFRIGPRHCGALAMTANGKVWGGADRDGRDAAKLAALENCQKRTNEQCVIRANECNR